MISSQNKSDSQANTSVPVPSKSTSDPETGQASSKLRLVRPWEKRRKSKDDGSEEANIDEDYDSLQMPEVIEKEQIVEDNIFESIKSKVNKLNGCAKSRKK